MSQNFTLFRFRFPAVFRGNNPKEGKLRFPFFYHKRNGKDRTWQRNNWQEEWGNEHNVAMHGTDSFATPLRATRN